MTPSSVETADVTERFQTTKKSPAETTDAVLSTDRSTRASAPTVQSALRSEATTESIPEVVVEGEEGKSEMDTSC